MTRSALVLALLFAAPCSLKAMEKAYVKAAGKLSDKAAAVLAVKKIAVLPFEYVDGRASLGGRLVAEKLTSAFVEVGRLTVIERSMIDKVMKELKFEASGAIDAGTAQQLGKGLGVDAIVTGILEDSQDGKQTTFAARLIKTDTFEILGSDERDLDKTWKDEPAAAAGPSGAKTASFAQACRGDLKEFCPKVAAGGGRQIRCLAKRRSDLSEGCAAYFPESIGNFTGPCRPDALKFCRGVQAGGGRILDCLKGHAGELSHACKTKLKL